MVRQSNLRSDVSGLLKRIPGYTLFNEVLHTREELAEEFYEEEIALTEKFFSEARALRFSPQVLELVESVKETEETGLPYPKAGLLAKALAKQVSSLADKYHAKFRPEIMRDVKRGVPGRYSFIPDAIFKFASKIDKAAKLVALGKMGVPLFLGYLGVTTEAYRRAFLSEDQIQKLAGRIASAFLKRRISSPHSKVAQITDIDSWALARLYEYMGFPEASKVSLSFDEFDSNAYWEIVKDQFLAPEGIGKTISDGKKIVQNLLRKGLLLSKDVFHEATGDEATFIYFSPIGLKIAKKAYSEFSGR